MKHIEIPLKSEKTLRYRLFEILPGALSWSILLLTLLFSFFFPTLVSFLILLFFLFWFARAVGLNVRVLQGYKNLQLQQKLDWPKMLDELEHLDPKGHSKALPKWHYQAIERVKESPTPLKPSDVLHAVVIAMYKEGEDVLEPTFKSLLDSDFDTKRLIVFIAYEERGGEDAAELAQRLAKKYKNKFYTVQAVMHPADIPNEVIGKGGNITYAGRELLRYVEREKINPEHVMVTTLDADNHPHKHYFSALTYTVAITPDPVHVSYQPISIYTNNIWDVPAPMRVIATGNSFWNITLSLRPHMIRNFASHAQSLAGLIKTDFWSTRTVVEDGHQYWRSYIRFDGNYEVYPLYLPIYQDAVLSDGYVKTLKAQFTQLRRWSYGASDIAYLAEKAFFLPNNISRGDKITKFLRMVEGHVSWATAALIIAFAALIPAFWNADNIAANQLPIIASRIQTIALIGILITFFLSLKTLPPKPERYKRHRTVFMVLQWVLLPLTTIVFNTLAALVSQTQLMFGKYMDVFAFTEKTVKK